MTALATGQVLGRRYELLRPLGRGGSGEVWLTRDIELDRVSAARIVPLDGPADHLAALEREQRAGERLDHPGIVRLLGVQRLDGYALLLREHVDGDDLRRLRGAPPAELLPVMRAVADALDHAHRRGVLHRDLKLANVLLDLAGQPHLVDLGLATAPAEAAASGAAPAGGTPLYMSPERFAGAPPAPADDLYALGVMFYELVTGLPPFWPDFSPERVRLEPAPPLAAAEPVPPRLAALVARLLAKSPAERPADAAAVRDELDRAIEELGRAGPPTRPERILLTPPPRPDLGAAEPALDGRDPAVRGPAAPAPSSAPAAAPTALWLLLGGLGTFGVAAVVVVLWLPGQFGRDRRQAAAAPGIPASETPSPLPAASPIGPAERHEAPEAPADQPAAAVPGAAGAAGRGGTEQPPAEAPSLAFARELAAALDALHRRDSAAARAALERARAARPEAPEIAATEARVAELERGESIARHLAEAAAGEQAEQWPAARDAYQAALALDPTVATALSGIERASRRARLAERLERHAGRPDRLSAEAVLREAEAVLAEAAACEPQGPRHRELVARLSAAVATARTPVGVVLRSDGRTVVTVYQHGRLGSFREHRLELRPGRYTVFGTRPGFRDVRRELVVEAGTPPAPIEVRCEDPI